MRSHWTGHALAISLVVAASQYAPDAAAATRTRDLTFSERQVTSTSAGVADELAMSSGGGLVTFVSTAPLGDNADGNPEVYVSPVFGTTPTAPVQVTKTTGSVQAHPSINTNGNVVMFQSTGTLDPLGSNGDRGPETFRINDWWLAGATPQQLTLTPAGPETLPNPPNPSGRISLASSNGGGDLAVFSSRGVFEGTSNPEQNPEIYLYDRLEDRYYQLTNTGSGIENLHPVMDEDGVSVAYLSNKDGNFDVYAVVVIEHPVAEDPCVATPNLPQCIDTNRPPTIVITPAGPQSVRENDTLTLQLVIDDPDPEKVAVTARLADNRPLASIGATLRLTLPGCDPVFDDCDCDPAARLCFFARPLQATFTWKPDYSRGGQSYPIVFSAVDQTAPLRPVNQTVTIAVVNVNRPPTLSVTPRTGSIKAGLPMQFTLLASDPDSTTEAPESLTMDVSGVSGGSMTPAPCSGNSPLRCQYTWTPQVGDIGAKILTFTARDAAGAATSVTANLDVVLNNPPVITTIAAVVQERACLMLVMKGTDRDGDPLVFDVDAATLPRDAVFLRGSATLHYHPATDVVVAPATTTRLTVRVRATDGMDTATRDVVITVVDSPDDQALFTSTATLVFSAAPGANVPVKFIVRNSGFSTWNGSSYALMLDSGSAGVVPPALVPLGSGETVIPGNLRTFNVLIPAPARAGTYSLRFRMSTGGAKFGASSGTVFIKVQ